MSGPMTGQAAASTGTLPASLWRDAREKGSVWGMFLTVMVYRFFGRWAAEPVLWVTAGFFFLRDGRMRAVSRQYLQKARQTADPAKAPGWTLVYRHFLSFARTSLDRFDVWSDRLGNYTFHSQGEDHVTGLLAAGRGAVLIGAHLGNFDALRVLGKRQGAKVHILMDRRNSRKFSALLRRFCPSMEEGVVEYDPDSIDTIFELKRAIERGEFVGLLGDRLAAENTRGAGRVSSAVFLGEKALFPQAPFIFAAHLECPVLLLFAMRRANRVYDFYVEPFAERIDLVSGGREESLARCAIAYAARLEHYCRKYPLQWFNFYDFWSKPS